jgi:hypothetical protein
MESAGLSEIVVLLSNHENCSDFGSGAAGRNQTVVYG